MENRFSHSAWITNDGAANSAGAESSVFPWWSFTKTVLAICALRLVEQGRLDLDAPLHERSYTLRQLMQHRAGVPNYSRLKAYQDAVARNDAAWSRDRLLSIVGADRLSFQPGAGWAYSNVGYMFVREIIEGATGLSLGAALEELLFGPLGVRSVRLAAAPSDFADVFWPDLRTYDPRWVYHGCLTGTPVDAVKVLHALLLGQILRPATLHTMLERHELGGAIPGRPWTACGYGLGLMSGRMGEAGRAIGHSGSGPHSSNAVYHCPDLASPITVATYMDSEDEGLAETDAMTIALQAGR